MHGLAEALVLGQPEAVGRADVAHVDGRPAERRLVAVHAGEREGAEGRAVVGDAPGDRLRALLATGRVVVEPGELQADSTDSAPPPVKNTWPRPGGASSARRSDSSTAVGWLMLQTVENGSLAIWAEAAAASSSP